ncbi:hypothetical protein MLD52_20990, partial [Puniceicoccaceae bacterium K14]|nr:hypothetical protein [Puniceicoccaceae bacterium K14]
VTDNGLALADGSDGWSFAIDESATPKTLSVSYSAAVDSDNDGVIDSEDAFPNDPNETVDTDSDGTGDNADTDDDGDGVEDSEDAFPLNPAESKDTDEDGIGDNEDPDDDGDDVLDVDEYVEFVNISTRGYVLDGDAVMIAGFVIEGTDPITLLLQGVGPELDDDPFFLGDVLLQDPKIGLYNDLGELIVENDDWESDDATIVDASDDSGAFPLTLGSKSAALLVTVDPGAYTVILNSGAGGAIGGVALVEVYQVPEDEAGE